MKRVGETNENKGPNRTVTTYRETRMQHAEQLRHNVAEAAALLLQEEGPEAVTVRRIAERMECSTKIIYSLFGSKEGLAKRLYMDGCKLLADAFEAVPKREDPTQYLLGLADAYWLFAQTESGFYQLMFGGAFTDFKPDEESMQGTISALRQVMNALSDAAGRGIMLNMGPELAVQMIWAPLHGVVHLYQGGHLADENAAKVLYNRLLSAVLQSIFVK